jgi:hypothetical protein
MVEKKNELKAELEKKVKRLDELVKRRSKAYCATVHSSGSEVKRETEIDELEQDIKRIENEIRQQS